MSRWGKKKVKVTDGGVLVMKRHPSRKAKGRSSMLKTFKKKKK